MKIIFVRQSHAAMHGNCLLQGTPKLHQKSLTPPPPKLKSRDRVCKMTSWIKADTLKISSKFAAGTHLSDDVVFLLEKVIGRCEVLRAAPQGIPLFGKSMHLQQLSLPPLITPPCCPGAIKYDKYVWQPIVKGRLAKPSAVCLCLCTGMACANDACSTSWYELMYGYTSGKPAQSDTTQSKASTF